MVDAKDYAMHSIGDPSQHRFLSIGNLRYKCAQEKCPARRILNKRLDVVEVVNENAHNHEDVSVGKKLFLPNKVRKEVEKLGPGNIQPAQIQSILAEQVPDLKITPGQLQNRRKNEKRRRKVANWGQWIRLHSTDDDVVGMHITDGVKVAVIASSATMARVFGLTPPEFMVIDGNADHSPRTKQEKYTLLAMGTQDRAHHFHLVAFGVISGGENAAGTSIFLSLVQHYLKEHNLFPLPSKWLLDGSSGLRDGIRQWHKEAEDATELILAMCYYHIVAAVKMKTDYLSKQDRAKS